MSAARQRNWVSPSVIANEFAVSDKTIRKMVLRGEFPADAVAKIGTCVRLDYDVVVAQFTAK